MKIVKWIVALVIIGALGYGWYWYRHRPQKPEVIFYRSQEVMKGSVTQEVTATGIIAPVKKVSVTTQVTGKIVSLAADFNSRIKEGQVIATIDPETYESSLASAKAQLKNNEANLEKTLAQLKLSKKELERQKKLFERDMTTESDLDSAQANYDQLLATQKSNEAAIEQSRASVKTAEKNLKDCTINSPVTGVVIDRSVEEGQTVVSSMNATGLFTVATELTRVKVEAAIPEADIGGVAVGQKVFFTVDAYKTRFKGVVTQIRLASATTSNVVTYPVIIEAENPDEKLFPGMTANISIIIEEAADVILIPNAATRFVPPSAGKMANAGEHHQKSAAVKGGPDGAPKFGDENAAMPPPAQDGADEDMLPPSHFSENSKVIWVADSLTEIHPVMVELGITDSVNTVVIASDEELLGKKVVVGKMSASMPNFEQQTSNPFMPTPPGRNRRNGNGGRPAGGPGPR